MMQALSVSIGNIFLIGVYVADKFEYILFSVLISTVFTLIVYTFVSVLGNVGKGISVVLMVLQISSSGGTFPIQVTPPFFSILTLSCHSPMLWVCFVNLLGNNLECSWQGHFYLDSLFNNHVHLRCHFEKASACKDTKDEG
ncbi:hypothetical protein KEH51_05330 [[Brevibacterium] frigoritolerans]|uniref:Uncharacterized protein n=1 Tax=Peribacillus frigoritolerans TaxID=450367 RepID=A0A941FPU3_9BACI|nr:hypothetical protein [Peribacillus frigoritolerans]